MSQVPAAQVIERPVTSVEPEAALKVVFADGVSLVEVRLSLSEVTASDAISEVPTAEAAISDAPTASAAISEEPTAFAAICEAPTESVARVGFGYVPERLPPAVPVGVRESLSLESFPAQACVAPVPKVLREAVPAAASEARESFDSAIAADADTSTFAIVPSAIFALVTAPSRIWFVVTARLASVAASSLSSVAVTTSAPRA